MGSGTSGNPKFRVYRTIADNGGFRDSGDPHAWAGDGGRQMALPGRSPAKNTG